MRHNAYALILLKLLFASGQTTTTECGSLACQNGGQCLDTTFQQGTSEESNAEVTGDLLTKCICPPGYGGITCSYHHGQICAEGQTSCKHGSSKCVPNELMNDVLECPCDTAYAVSEFAGQMCENPATTYCDSVWNHETNRQHFCTNGGNCVGGSQGQEQMTAESDAWGMVESDTPVRCECRKFLCFVVQGRRIISEC